MIPTSYLTALAIVTLALIGCRCAAQSTPPDEKIPDLLRERVEAKVAPGIVVGLIGTNGTKIFAAGNTSLSGGADVDGDTVFEIGSMTKVFTGLLLADMVHRGEVKLDDPISKYLPASVKAPTRNGKEITLLDLATHRSGLPRLPDNLSPQDGLDPYADYTFENLCAFLSDYKLTRDIGAKYEYSNLGFGLLGTLLARRAGTSYEALLTERIFRPLGMTHTAITLSPELKARFAAGHNTELEPVKPWTFDALAGCGAIRSTANDLLKFIGANLQLTLSDLGPALQSMREPRNSTEIPRTKIGLAWHITDRNYRRIVWHNGQTGGFHSFAGFDPTNKTGVVVLANAACALDDLGFHLLDSNRRLNKLKPQKEDSVVKLDASELDRLVGRYQLTEDAFFNLRRDGDRLMAQLTGQACCQIYPKSRTNFFYKVVEAQIDFNCDAAGKVQSLTLHQNGADQTAEKISDQPPKERQAISADTKLFDKFVGEYELAPGAVFTVRREGERLLARLTGQSFIEIYPEDATNFFYKVVDAQITFIQSSDGKATALVLHQNGADQRAEKTK